MSKPLVFVVGAGGHAKVVLDILERDARYDVAFLIDENPGLKGREVYGYRVLGNESDLASLRDAPSLAIVAIGNNHARGLAAQRLRAAGVTLIKAIHPDAKLARGVTIGEGSVVMAGTVINSDTSIGQNAIINTCASVDHDCIIGDEVHLAPGCRLCGHVQVGMGALVGAGCVVVPSKRIGDNATIGAGSVVIDDVAEKATVTGAPARQR